METVLKEMTVNGQVYVLKGSEEKAKLKDNMKYCIVRTYSAGVFAGYVESRTGKEVIIRDVRRIWYWSGACSLSQLAKEGVKNPQNCKFAVPVDKIEVLEAIEIIECTEQARQSIINVPEWKTT